MSRDSIIPDLDLFGVLDDVAVDGLVDIATLATCYPENQVIEGCTTEDIHMITCFFVSASSPPFDRSQTNSPVLGPPLGEKRSGS